jgi:A/G-specific adenine glycosylase
VKRLKTVSVSLWVAEIVEADNHKVNAVAFRKRLISWGRKHFRSFSWRLTDEPYRILMAEVMLHRTQASQVVPVYERFVARYPDVSALARTKRKALHSTLSSLGLHWRIDLVHDMAKDLMVHFNGQVPQEKDALLSLPGVSDYIASAVCCFAWNQKQPLIDTNTVRVIGRLFGLEIKDSSRRNRYFRELIAALVDPGEPRAYNYALLDLAQRVCTKKRLPECSKCPVRTYCTYGANMLGNILSSHSNERTHG